ncbi:MAG: ArsR family transcriptional regulator [Nitrosopumilaceae archaeon]
MEMSNPNIIQINEYNINQKIIESLANVCSRAVLFSILTQAKDATQISEELKISVSNVYKTLSHLEDLALVNVDKFVISSEGKKIKKYKSRIGQVEILIRGIEPVLNLYPNNEKTRHIIQSNQLKT